MRDALNICKTKLNLVLLVISLTTIIMREFVEQNYFKIISHKFWNILGINVKMQLNFHDVVSQSYLCVCISNTSPSSLNQSLGIFRNHDKMIGDYEFQFELCLFKIIYIWQSSNSSWRLKVLYWSLQCNQIPLQ